MNTRYTPPFTISAEAISLIAEISAQIERYAIRLEQSDGLKLRKANRIKTIHSSLAIEGNALSEDQVSDIIEGKQVFAPTRQIQEVKNAIKTYDLYRSLNPFKVSDLLRAHGVMMEALSDDAGMFRKGSVGVFNGNECIHLAPPAQRVPLLIDELFSWLKSSKDHLLIRSCVFHYEFEFIHPFNDGNGRIGRLWQSLILGKLHPIFEYLPIENLVYANQQQYYDAINESSKKNDCSPFIDFMLNEILNTIKRHKGNCSKCKVPNKVPNKIPNKLLNDFPDFSDSTWNVLRLIMQDPHASAIALGERLGTSDRMIRKHISLLKSADIIKRIGSNKKGYWEVTITE